MNQDMNVLLADDTDKSSTKKESSSGEITVASIAILQNNFSPVHYDG